VRFGDPLPRPSGFAAVETAGEVGEGVELVGGEAGLFADESEVLRESRTSQRWFPVVCDFGRLGLCIFRLGLRWCQMSEVPSTGVRHCQQRLVRRRPGRRGAYGGANVTALIERDLRAVPDRTRAVMSLRAVGRR
jgi:hypothetical protein